MTEGATLAGGGAGPATVVAVAIYPLKGFPGVAMQTAQVVPDTGLAGDRVMALAHGDGVDTGADLSRLGWMSKNHFLMQNDWPALAGLWASWSPDQRALVIRSRGTEHKFDLTSDRGRQRLCDFMVKYLKAGGPSRKAMHPTLDRLVMVGGPGQPVRYPDRIKAHLSILNIESLRALSAAHGASVDIRAFRGNLLVEGWPAFAELEIEGRQFRLGTATIRTLKPIGRCHNINVDPVSGLDHQTVLDTLQNRFGHTKFGVMAEVVTGGTVAPGDRLLPL